LARDKPLNKFVKMTRDSDARGKRREALGSLRSAPLLYCVNVNRTSLDHLLLGKYADVDKNVE